MRISNFYEDAVFFFRTWCKQYGCLTAVAGTLASARNQRIDEALQKRQVTDPIALHINECDSAIAYQNMTASKKDQRIHEAQRRVHKEDNRPFYSGIKR